MFFAENVIEFYKLFDEENYPNFSEEEKQLVSDRHSQYFVEGIHIWDGKQGVYSNHGQFQFIKNVDGTDIIEYICKMIDLFSFEGFFAIDFHGFCRKSNDLIFTHASQNTSLFLLKEKQSFFINSVEAKTKLRDHFKSKSKNDLLSDWFFAHDNISNYRRSGVIPERLISSIIYFEPSALHVREIFSEH